MRPDFQYDLTSLSLEPLAQAYLVGCEAELLERRAGSIDNTRMTAAVADVDADREDGDGLS